MRHFQQNMRRWAKLNTPLFLLVAPVSTEYIFKTWDSNLDMRFVLILNYKHVRSAGLRVYSIFFSWKYLIEVFADKRSYIEEETFKAYRSKNCCILSYFLGGWFVHRHENIRRYSERRAESHQAQDEARWPGQPQEQGMEPGLFQIS